MVVLVLMYDSVRKKKTLGFPSFFTFSPAAAAVVVAAEAAKAAAAKGATHGGSTFGEGLTRSGNEISCD